MQLKILLDYNRQLRWCSKKYSLKGEVSLFCSFQENIFLLWHEVEVPAINRLEQQMHPLVFVWHLNIAVICYIICHVLMELNSVLWDRYWIKIKLFLVQFSVFVSSYLFRNKGKEDAEGIGLLGSQKGASKV